MVVLLVKNDTCKYNLDSVRAGMTGAAPLTEETSLALQKKFPKWIFGQGESSLRHCPGIVLWRRARRARSREEPPRAFGADSHLPKATV